MFVRLFVDENLDRMVPISKQPKEKIQAIIDSCRRQFPEYQERARKRIRTYLKSCRRMKRSGFEMVSFEWKHSPRFHPNPTCKPWHYLFFHPSVFFYLFFHDVRSQGFCLLVCFPPSPLHLPEVYLSLVYSTRSTRWASAHRPMWYRAIDNEGHMSQVPWEPASHSCLLLSVTPKWRWGGASWRLWMAWEKGVCAMGGSGWVRLRNTVLVPTLSR